MKMKKDKGNIKRIIFIVSLVLFLGVMLAGYPCEAEAAPSLFIEKNVYDFGTIMEGRDMPHDFLLENRGNETLKILKVRSNCACAVAEYTEEIPPGRSGIIGVVFYSKGSEGNVKYKIRADTNDPEQEYLDLIVQGCVDPVMHVDPKKVMLEGNAGENIETELTITSDPRHHFKMLSAVSKKGKTSCSFEELEDPESSKYLLKVTNLSKEKGKYRDYIYVETDSDIRPGISITVKGDIR